MPGVPIACPAQKFRTCPCRPECRVDPKRTFEKMPTDPCCKKLRARTPAHRRTSPTARLSGGSLSERQQNSIAGPTKCCSIVGLHLAAGLEGGCERSVGMENDC